MSLETHSRLRNRIYPRKFDHEEAIRLRAENPALWTYRTLAEHFAVSERAIDRVVNPARRAQMEALTLRNLRNKREPCVGGCGKLVWTHSPGRTGYCPQCLGILRASPRVRENELQCAKCGLWKSDTEFGKDKRKLGRRSRRTECRPCETIRRREFRATHREQENVTTKRYYHAIRREKRGYKMEYVVLKSEGEGRYTEVKRVDANSADAAIEKAVEQTGQYVAIVESRFEIVPVEPIRSLRVLRSPKSETAP